MVFGSPIPNAILIKELITGIDCIHEHAEKVSSAIIPSAKCYPAKNRSIHIDWDPDIGVRIVVLQSGAYNK